VTVIGAQLAPGSEEERLQQVAVLLNLTGEDTPLVLAADLGASPQDVVYRQLLETGFLDPDTALGIERGFTFPAANPTERRDYILLRDLFPRDALQVNSPASDHRLVVVEVEWP
jgi:endonuclease/exonuclease/phosphatase family metal-dependent hydrolase